MKEMGSVHSVRILDAEGEYHTKRYFMSDSVYEAIGMAEDWIREAFPNSGLVVGDVNLVAEAVLDIE